MVSAAIVGVYLHLPTSFADPQVPLAVLATQVDPYYFSEGGFGIELLKYYGIPLTPYLTPGTSEDSKLGRYLKLV